MWPLSITRLCEQANDTTHSDGERAFTKRKLGLWQGRSLRSVLCRDARRRYAPEGCVTATAGTSCRDAPSEVARSRATPTVSAKLTSGGYGSTPIHSAVPSDSRGTRSVPWMDAQNQTSAGAYARCITGGWNTMVTSTGRVTGQGVTLRGVNVSTIRMAYAEHTVTGSSALEPPIQHPVRSLPSATASASTQAIRWRWPMAVRMSTG